jgi:6-phosphogluconolactonase
MTIVLRPNDFFAEAAEWIAGRLVAAQQRDGWARLSLCGGTTPAPIYAQLATRSDINWQQVIITFGDERCVGPDDEQSNYRMARLSLLESAGIPENNVIRIEGELAPSDAAKRCEDRLLGLAKSAGDAWFRHDLILLGMGDDGHTASLFPDTTGLSVTDHWVVANYVPKFEAHRITFTYPLLAVARDILFLVNGAGKHAMVDQVLAGDPNLPASAVRADSVTWMVGG